MDWTCKLWTGLVKHGLVKHGLVKHGLAKHGLVKHGLVKHGLVKHGLVKHGLEKHGLVKHGLDLRANILSMICFSKCTPIYRETSKKTRINYSAVLACPCPHLILPPELDRQ
jgi:hypothetical protein